MRPERQARRARAVAVIERLGQAYPEADTALRFRSPLELLVAVVLSAQCTDERVNRVTPALFARFPSVDAFAGADPDQVEPLIRSCGLGPTKARAIVSACRMIRAAGGEVPTSRQALARLPGVGNKSAGVVAMHLSGEPALPVDTHIARLSHRLDLSRRERPDDIETDLRSLLPQPLWRAAHHRLIWHGRRICLARLPRCRDCLVEALCPKRGVPRAARLGR